jgi:hypothetical protein
MHRFGLLQPVLPRHFLRASRRGLESRPVCRASDTQRCAEPLGLGHHRRCVLHSFLFLVEIRSGWAICTVLDLTHVDSHRGVANGQCELELDFLSQEKFLVELRLFRALSSAVPCARGGSASSSQPILRLVRSLSRLFGVCNLVGISCLAPQ